MQKGGWVCGFALSWGWVCAATVTPDQFSVGSDSDRIGAAIAKAVETGERSVEIPRMNAKSGQPMFSSAA